MDAATASRKEDETGILDTAPARRTANWSEKILSDPVAAENLKSTQEGCNLEFKEKPRSFNNKRDVFDDNKSKACAFAFDNHCSRTMQNRTEKTSDFDMRIRDNPINSLIEIKLNVHAPTHAKCECEALTESFERLITKTKQGEN